MTETTKHTNHTNKDDVIQPVLLITMSILV